MTFWAVLENNTTSWPGARCRRRSASRVHTQPNRSLKIDPWLGQASGRSGKNFFFENGTKVCETKVFSSSLSANEACPRRPRLRQKDLNMQEFDSVFAVIATIWSDDDKKWNFPSSNRRIAAANDVRGL